MPILSQCPWNAKQIWSHVRPWESINCPKNKLFRLIILNQLVELLGTNNTWDDVFLVLKLAKKQTKTEWPVRIREDIFNTPLIISQEKAVAPHSSALAWKIPWTEEPGRLQVVKSWTQLSDFTYMHWRRQWQPIPVFLPGESQGRGSLVGCRLWGRTEPDTTEAMQQQQLLIISQDGTKLLASGAVLCLSCLR